MDTPLACAACGWTGLAPHMNVAGEAGEKGLIPTTDRFGTALADIVRCESCGHMQLERMPSEADLERAYAEAESGDYLGEEAGQRRTAAKTLELVERYTEVGTLLDLGCWVGFLLSEARARGWVGIGVEPSAYASQYARDELGLEVITSDLFAAPLDGRRFDAVVMGDVIEHLPDPAAALAQIAGLLSPSGVLAMALPDAGSKLARIMGPRWWSVIPTHVQYFTRSSMRSLLDRTGYEILPIVTAPKAFTVRYYLERIGGYSPTLARHLVAGAERTRVAERAWAPDFRDRMLVLARIRSVAR